MKSNKKEYYLFLIVFFVLWLTITVFVMDPNIIRKIKSSISDLVIKDDIVVIKRNTTKEQLMVKSQEFNLKVFSNDIEISNNDIIKTNDKLENNGEEHLIAVLGDVNKDGKVDFSDVSRTYRIFKNMVTVNKVERTAADSNEDNIVNISDASRTYRIFKNLIPDDDTIVTKYTVSFDSDGGEELVSIERINGETYGNLPEAVKTGYTFIGWYLGDQKIESTTVVNLTSNVTLKAKYNIINYSINYNLDGGSTTNPSTYTVETNDIVLSDAQKDGVEFVGWTGSNGDTPEKNVTIPKGSTGNKEYTANYSAHSEVEYKVIHKQKKLDGSYNTVLEETLSAPYGTKVKPTVKTYEGFISPEPQEITVKQDGTSLVEYKYERKEYKFTINDSEDVISSLPSGNYPYETEITLTAKEKEGYDFSSWSNGETTNPVTITLTENTTIRPIYTAKTYVVEFNANTGTGEMASQTFTYDEEKALNKNTFTKLGNKFIGWNTKADGTGTPYLDEAVVKNLATSGTVTLYAQFIAETYTITFDSDGGTPIDSQQVIGGDIVIKPEDPVKEGYEFLNWTVNGIVYDFNNPVIDNIILKASYRKITNSIEGYFLNTQIDYEEDGKNKFFTSNESLIFKTENGKIIMVDTADNNAQVQNVIINKLREISSSDQIVIDYLLMTHPHGDHFGNLEYIITHPNIRVKNIIYKKENLYKNIENILNKENVLQVINSKNINIIDVSSLNESMHKINLDNVTMTLFNLSDAYKNYTADQCKKTFYAIKFSSSVRDTYENGKVQENIKKDGKYIYLNSLDPDDNTLKYSDTIENISSDLGLDLNNNPNRRYYAYLDKRSTLCSDNTNSIVLLLEVNTGEGKKYIYVPSDLSNNGYPFYGINNLTAEQEFFVPKIYSSGIDYVFENTFDEQLNNINNSWSITNNHFVESNESIKIARETRVANRIRNYLGEDELNNIVIYQQSHHGYSNSKDAVDTLNLNRSGVYSIATHRQNGKNSPDSLLARSYHYVLNNTTRLATGGSGNGVYCYIKSDNSYKCQRVQ